MSDDKNTIEMKTRFNNPNMHTPVRAHERDAGMDLQANIKQSITLMAGEQRMIPTGVLINMGQCPYVGQAWEAQVRSRSGMVKKHELVVNNAPGTIDEGYTGEIRILLKNTSNKPQTVFAGMRIAQIVFTTVNIPDVVLVDKFSESTDDRGDDGFGSTGYGGAASDDKDADNVEESTDDTQETE